MPRFIESRTWRILYTFEKGYAQAFMAVGLPIVGLQSVFDVEWKWTMPGLDHSYDAIPDIPSPNTPNVSNRCIRCRRAGAMIRTLLWVSLLGVAIAVIFKIILSLDVNKRVYNHRPGACRSVEGIKYGAEDIALLEEDGVAIVTSGVIYLRPRKEEVKGQIFLYDFKQKGPWKAVPMKINGEYNPDSFHPHGISHITTEYGARLFVIVHTSDFKHSVMVFDWRRNTLELDIVRTIRDEKFIRPNDLVAIDEEAFILSNDGYVQSPFLNLLEIISFYPSGSVVYYDGKKSSYLIERVISPNGLILSKDRTHLFIAFVNTEQISVYKGKDPELRVTKKNWRPPLKARLGCRIPYLEGVALRTRISDNLKEQGLENKMGVVELPVNFRSISHVVDVPLLTAPDNFAVDKSGALWIGAHPVAKETLVHLHDFDDPKPTSPSQVLRVVFSKDYKSWEITEPFTDDGRLISASAVAVPYENQLLIGSEVKGQIFLYDFNQKDGWKAEPLKIIGEYDQENFHPHGISHVPTATGARLFVISHSNTFEHSVWVFDWKKTNSRQLQLVKVIRDEKFIRPNDLVAVSDEAFILTNDGAGQTVFTNFLEMVSFYPSGSVVYYDGTTSTYMISRTVSPNGVILSKDRKYLFISHVNYETVTVYKIGTNYRSLSRVVDVPLLTAADNFYVDKTGALWTGAHPVMKDAMAHLKDFDDPVPIAPSQVLRIVFSKDYKSWEITEPFVDDGRLISASSIAVPYKNQLLIGSVCRQLVHCDVTPETV
ncbi:unnamed protein product [Nippostrongylus brasiliensis]|uniref:DNA-binding beta-propeller fold protein YncE n=1 Tax=Nippostrongylus brasiliensis TaxID=27835 RepID=A0A0N4YF28_NIPBR|nr:unnamed protein product [Nippostrongylus brasiliensis]